MKKTRRIFISALALVLAFSLCACSPLETIYGGIFEYIFEDIMGLERKSDSEDSSASEADTDIDIDISSYDYTKPEYTGYDEDSIKEACENFAALADEEDFDLVKEAYDLMSAEFDTLYDQEILAYLVYCADAADEDLYEDYNELYLLAVEYADEAYVAMKAVLEGPCAEEFADYIGAEAVSDLEEYEEMTDQELEWAEEENDLIAEYNKAVEEFDASGSSDYSELNATVGPIYLELVALRTEMAQYYGYDDYAQYADEMIYDRDFSSDEAKVFHAAVKEVSSQYFSMLYGSYAYFGLYYYGTSFTADELTDTALLYSSEISSYVSQTLEIMLENDLCDIADDDARINGSFSTTFSSGAPTLFINMNGWADFQTMTHELGHCVNSLLTSQNGGVLLSESGCYDILEIHSNGLEALYTEYYDDIFGSVSNYAYSFTLMELMVNVVDGAIYDEFQRTIYENPDMTLDEINDLFESLQEEYGNPYASEDKYSWVAVSHNFESPMYYLSYGVSGFAAIQIWALAQDDYEEAVEIWEDIVCVDASTIGYLELIEDAGLDSFLDDGVVESVCGEALETAYSLSSQQQNGRSGLGSGGWGW